MPNTLKWAVGAALIAASQLAMAGLAQVQISNLTLSASGGAGWYWLPKGATWLSPTAGAATGLIAPSFDDSVAGWHGDALASSVTDGTSVAQAQLTSETSGGLNGVTAQASVATTGGQSGWAFAQVFDGQIMVGSNTTITLSETIDNIFASGPTTQANAYIELCTTDFTTDICSPLNFAEAFVDGNSPAYSGPNVLTASWTNPGSTTWAKMHIGLTASADSLANTIPEPASIALVVTGLAGIGFSRRRA
ncbi:PEP-CTERM sorting domain-containing protein [Roseateles saccharophilus]|uniref:Putative secreted protein with PEP-CTERM sorting signal n=2 Tax=Roseateles saccharophilus TaxID=304 RepID=A0A4R3U8Z0_ROSSA|nr:putative secreted protein with PEP-CTERM sorting signal [Roseateles saccharophilus]